MNRLCIIVLICTLFNSAFAVDCPLCGIKTAVPEIKLPEWPLQLIEVEKVNYERNSQATFCKRPPEIIDTIVLHHSETPPTTTPLEINQMHLDRDPKDPWYMIGYSYVINSPYSGAKVPRARVTEGRPLEIVGAHAGGKAFVNMDKEQNQMFLDGKVVCGKEDGEFKVDPELVQNGKIKANITTIGLVVNGNYSVYSPRTNPNGYDSRYPRNPTKSTLEMTAKIACQLQKKYPRIKNIKWHNFYHSTSCPGNIKNHIGQIIALARNYGCEFK